MFGNSLPVAALPGMFVYSQWFKTYHADLYNRIFEFPQLCYIQYSGTSVTASLFIYKKVFDEVGLFMKSYFRWAIENGENKHSKPVLGQKMIESTMLQKLATAVSTQ